MERKNTVLLTVIAVATLLVAVVGATFAYYTATTTGTQTGSGTGDVTTAKLGNTTFTFTGKSLEHTYLNYPGGLAVFGSEAKLTKEGDGEYDLTFDLELDYTNKTDTDLYWALYMTTTPLTENLDPKCKIVMDTTTTPGETHYWYNNSGTAGEKTSCTLESSQKETLTSGSMIAYGKFEHANGGTGKIDSSTVVGEGTSSEGNETSIQTCDKTLCDPTGQKETNPLSSRTLDTQTTTNKYYYLVVQYPNQDSPQQQGSGSLDSPDIQITLKVKDNSAKVVARGTQGQQTTTN